MKTKSWLRLYHEFADDPKIQMLAFEDQRHYVMVLCLKGRGVLDSNTPTAEYRERMIAKALGLDPLTSREVKFRLMEPGLIDENWQPVKWAERQFESDNSTERVQKYREKRKRFGNVSSKQDDDPGGRLVNRDGNVSVTAQIRAEQRENSPPGNSLSAKSADAERAIPTGSLGAAQEPPKPEPKPSPKGKGKTTDPELDAAARFEAKLARDAASRAAWWRVAVGTVFRMANLYGAGKPFGNSWDDIDEHRRPALQKLCNDLATRAVDLENEIPPVPKSVIDTTIDSAIAAELQGPKPEAPPDMDTELAQLDKAFAA